MLGTDSLYLSDKSFEVLESENGDCIIKDKINNKFFFKKNLYVSKKYSFQESKHIKWNLKDTLFMGCILISIICAIYLVLQYDEIYNAIYEESSYVYIEAFIYLIFSIIIHEAAHYLSMYYYGRKPGKIKLRFRCLSINIVTDTTESYLLPRYRRIFVYYAGVMVDCIMYAATILMFPNKKYLMLLVLWGIVYNLIPIGGLDTDGYHIIINAICNIFDTKNNRSMFGKITKYIFLMISIYVYLISFLKLVNIDINF